MLMLCEVCQIFQDYLKFYSLKTYLANYEYSASSDTKTWN